MSIESMHHLVVFYDIQESARLTNPEKLAMRNLMHECCVGAVEAASIRGEQVTIKDLGDGAMVLFPALVPKSQVLGPWLEHFHTRLHRGYQQSAQPSQVRLAVHCGELVPSLAEYTGATLDFGARLVDAPVAKRVLAATPSASLAVIVSDVIYDQVVRHGGGGLAPASFTRIGLRVKETDTSAWLHLPGWARVPMPPDSADGAGTPRSAGAASGAATGTAAGTPDAGDGARVSVSGGNVGVIGTATVNGPFTVSGAPDGAR